CAAGYSGSWNHWYFDLW
nr:immunoglobulin heavy chain junction region [Macaca mulatta]MOX59686.1 immunoglobulin heavy chain junction region [Macaca mulatta]MOX59989.1 immunoglobulin heavy chain junction region [Macaca mulatta]MOX60156.1 immunoglobulin heavy chain junction region [Macaca mulatta]MOX60259.1 immunoglobulin heavy chain junction region [Macaca mulatta]